MLVQSHQLPGMRITSLHTGQPAAEVTDIIIDPFNLEIAGFYTTNTPDDILLTRDIREMNIRRAIVNSADVFSSSDELIRLKEILGLKYDLIGKQVVTKQGSKLGKVESYVIDTRNWAIQKIYTHRPVWKAFNNGTLVIDRKQIIEVDENTVTVEDATIAKPKFVTRPVPQ